LVDQVAGEAPRLVHAIAFLPDEHVALREQISAAIEHLGAVEPSDMRTEIADLLRALVRHRQHGSDLVHEGFVVDLGALD